jgi:hypothetical protein
VAQSSDSAGFTLRTLRPYLRATDPLNLLGARVGALDGGVPAYATFPYESGILPASLHVDVPGGVRWTAAVLLSE